MIFVTLKVRVQENNVYREKVFLTLFKRSLDLEQAPKISFHDLSDQDFAFDAVKNGQSFSTNSGSAVCILPNKLG
jgi:hypothetical protein